MGYLEEGNRLILAGIIIATALFLYGVAGVNRRRGIKLAMTAMGYTAVLASVIAVIAA